jgi:hypothetical protein
LLAVVPSLYILKPTMTEEGTQLTEEQKIELEAMTKEELEASTK